MLCDVLPFLCRFSSYLVSGQYPPSTIFTLLGFLMGITGVNLDPELS